MTRVRAQMSYRILFAVPFMTFSFLIACGNLYTIKDLTGSTVVFPSSGLLPICPNDRIILMRSLSSMVSPSLSLQKRLALTIVNKTQPPSGGTAFSVAVVHRQKCIYMRIHETKLCPCINGQTVPLSTQ